MILRHRCEGLHGGRTLRNTAISWRSCVKKKNCLFWEVTWNFVFTETGKGKAVPLLAWSGPEGSRKLRVTDFMTTAQDSGKVVSLTHRPPLPQEIHLVVISVRGRVDPRAIVRPEEICHWKIPMTPSGIEPVTCRFVALCPNHYATARPRLLCSLYKRVLYT